MSGLRGSHQRLQRIVAHAKKKTKQQQQLNNALLNRTTVHLTYYNINIVYFFIFALLRKYRL